MATVSQVTEAAFTGRFQDAMSAGADAAAASMANLGDRTAATGAAIEATEERVRRSGPTWSTIGRRFDETAMLADRTAAAQRRFAAEVETTRQAVARGATTAEQAAEVERRAAIVRDKSIADAKRSAEDMRKRFASVEEGSGAAAKAIRLQAHEVQNLSFQAQDFIVQVASGGGFFTPFVQQAPQAVGAVGGFSRSLALLRQVVTSVPGALGIAGVAIGGLGLILNAQQGELAATEVKLRGVIGYYEGLGEAAVKSARDVARSGSGVSVEDAIGAQVSLRRAAAGAGIRGLDFGSLTIQAADLAARLGIELPAALGKFQGAMRDPAALVDDLRQQGFPGMTEALRLTVSRLAEGGERGDAFALVLDRVRQNAAGAAREGLSPLGSVLTDIKDTLGGYWDGFLEQLNQIVLRVKAIRDENQRLRTEGGQDAVPVPEVGSRRGTLDNRDRGRGYYAPDQYLDVLGLIRSREAGIAGYDSTLSNGAWLPGGREVKLTEMTVAEVLRMQGGMRAAQREAGYPEAEISSAAGAYQIVGRTLQGLVRDLGIDPNTTRFDAPTQDRLARENLRQVGDPSSPGYLDRLRYQWTGLQGVPDSTIRSALAITATSVSVDSQQAPRMTFEPVNTPAGTLPGFSPGLDTSREVLETALRIARGAEGSRVVGATPEARAASAAGLLGSVNPGLAQARQIGDAAAIDELTKAQRELNVVVEQGIDPQDRMIRAERERADAANALSPAQAELTQKMVDYDRTLREAGRTPDPAKRAEYLAQVLRAMRGPFTQAINDTRLQAEGQARLAEAYGQGGEALGHALNVERAMEVVRKQGITDAGEARTAVAVLAAEYDNLTRSQNDNQQRAANDTAQRGLDLLERERTLIGASADERERELAAFRARQSAEARPGGTSEGEIQKAERLARATADAQARNTQLSNSWGELARVGEQAFDRIGSAITEAFAQGSIKAVDFGGVVKAVISEVVQQMLRLAVINPILNAAFGGTRGTLDGILTVAGGAAGVVGGGQGGSSGGGVASLGGGGGAGGTLRQGADLVSGARKLYSGGEFNTGFSGVDGFLNTPAFAGQANAGINATGAVTNSAGYGSIAQNSIDAAGSASSAGVGSGGASLPLSYGQYAGAALGVAGGAYGVYSGLQRGGPGGYTSAAGGALTAGLSAAIIAGYSIPIYGWIAAAVLTIIGALLPGQKPSNREGNATIQLNNSQISIDGQTGAKRSDENRQQAAGAAAAVGLFADQLGAALGGLRIDGSVKIGAGDRDGLYAEINQNRDARKYFTFDKDEEGAEEKAAQALMDYVSTEIFRIAQRQATGDYGSIARNSADLAALQGNLEWYEGRYKPAIGDGQTPDEVIEAASQFGQSLASLKAPFQEMIDKATSLGLATGVLAEKQQAAVEAAYKARDAAVADINDGLQSRRDAAAGRSQIARELGGFDAQTQGQVASLIADLTDRLGIADAANLDTVGTLRVTRAEERDTLLTGFQRDLEASRWTAQGRSYLTDVRQIGIDRRSNAEMDQYSYAGANDALQNERLRSALAQLDEAQLADVAANFRGLDDAAAALAEQMLGASRATREAAEAAQRAAAASEFWDADRLAQGRGYLNDLIGVRAATDAADPARRAAGIGQADIDRLFAGQVRGVLGGLDEAQLRDVATNMRGLDDAVANLAQGMLDAGGSAKALAAANDNAERLASARQGVSGVVTSLTDYARSLRMGDQSPLSLRSQYDLAAGAFGTGGAAAQAGDWRSIEQVRSLASDFLSTSRAVNGSGVQYAADVSRVLDLVSSVADLGEDRLTQSFMSAEIRAQTQHLGDLLRELIAETKAVRRETQQSSSVPARLAAAA